MIDIICFSHLKWDFVYQRPQHLLTRCTKTFRVFYIEEPIQDDKDRYTVSRQESGVYNVRLHVDRTKPDRHVESQQEMVATILREFNISDYLFWYYTPMALPVARVFKPCLVIYDCMDELSAFKNAPEKLKEYEALLLEHADLVFTGGISLYEAKKDKNPRVFAFPSSIDADHFGTAREQLTAPEDQRSIPSPQFGYAGVIDERMDIELLDRVSALQSEWQFIIIGPVVKIDRQLLPQRQNIHYLGMKSYNTLPAYLSGWDVAMIPFALNKSTEFISPTKTPEYLAAGKPVISTPIRDIVHPYGDNGLVHIVNTPEEFISAGTMELENTDKTSWLMRVDGFLSKNSWDKTWQKMQELIQQALTEKKSTNRITRICA